MVACKYCQFWLQPGYVKPFLTLESIIWWLDSVTQTISWSLVSLSTRQGQTMFRLDCSQLPSIWRTAILSEPLLLLWNLKNLQVAILFSVWKVLWKNYIAYNALNSRVFSTAGLFSDVCSRGPAFQRQCGLMAWTTRFKVLLSPSFILPASGALIFFLSCTLNAQNISQKSNC